MPTPTLYSITAGTARGTLDVTQVWSQDGDSPFASGYKAIVPITSGTDTYLIGLEADGTGTAFKATNQAPWFQEVPSSIAVGNFDVVNPFILGMTPWLLAYDSDSGVLSFYPVNSDLTAPQPPFTYSHKRTPLTTGFTVCEPVVINSLLYVVMYSFKTGDVNIWSLNVTPYPVAGSPAGTPALQILPVWVHQWAKSWDRFAFFYMGGESFFFKINFGSKLNVNIDHILDDPSEGSVEVGTWMQNQLTDPTKIDIVEPFTMGGGEPYYVTYRTDGSTDWFRIHADCQGWTKENSGSTIASASQVVPYQIGGDRFALFY
jgi:hypothetical protein